MLKNLIQKLTWRCKSCGSSQRGEHEDLCDNCYQKLVKPQKEASRRRERVQEALEGNISEAKEQLDKMRKIDWEEVLEIEKKNKDRKGIKQWVKRRID